jgi:hypothetical protein
MAELIKLEEFTRDFSAVINKASEQVRSYQQKEAPGAIYKPEQARYKLVVWFKDGNKRYFYSYDNKHFKDRVLTDEYEGLLKLLRLVHNYKDKYKNAILYATIAENKKTDSNYNFEVIKYDIFGNKKTNKAVNFVTKDKSVFLDLERAKNLGNPRI